MKILVVALMVSLLSACSSNGGIGFLSDNKPAANIYNTSFLRKNLIIGKSTTDDAARICGDTEDKMISSDGTEKWSYRNKPNEYSMLKSGVVRAVDTIKSKIPYNSATDIADSEYNKANGGRGSSNIVADKVTGTGGKDHSLELFFSNGILRSYSLN